MFKSLANLFSTQTKSEETRTTENILNQTEFIEKLKSDFFHIFGKRLSITEADGLYATFSYQFVPVHLCKVDGNNVVMLTNKQIYKCTEDTIAVVIEEARQQIARIQ